MDSQEKGALNRAKEEAKRQGKKQAQKYVKKALLAAIKTFLLAFGKYIIIILSVFTITASIINICTEDGESGNAYANGEFENVTNSIDLLKEFVHSWEGTPKVNSDRTKYVIHSDGVGHPTVGWGVDIHNGGFTKIFEDAGYPTNIGGEVDIDFVDAIEEQELQENLDYVTSKTEGLGLTVYQLHALVSRAYNCGNSGAIDTKRGSSNLNFADSYKKYWNNNTDNLFGKENTDYNNLLYTEYMNKPTTSDGKYLKGLENRRRSEWTLFQTGYYDRIDKWYTNELSSDTDFDSMNFLEVANSVHEKMEKEKWTYSQNSTLLKNNIDSSYNNSDRATCCATYVSIVIYKAGYATKDEMNGIGYHSSNALYNHFKSKWKIIDSYNNLQSGDIVFMSGGGKSGIGHVQIYAGNENWYNAGSNSAIQKDNPYRLSSSYVSARFIKALRP